MAIKHEKRNSLIGRAVIDQPRVDIREHGGREAMGARVGLESDAKAAGTKHRHIATGGADGDPRVPFAMHDQDGRSRQAFSRLKGRNRSAANR